MIHKLAVGFALAIAMLPHCQAKSVDRPPQKTLTAFADDAQLLDFFKRHTPESEKRMIQKARDRNLTYSGRMVSRMAPGPVATAKAAAADQGGIVKAHGKHLVILRRGRLLTVDIGDNRLTAVSAIDAYAPGTDPQDHWYDEMVVSGDTIAVIGFAGPAGSTEVGLFDIDDAGQLSYRATYHLRANDDYSPGNHAIRQVGSKLVFYTSLYIDNYQPDPYANLPAIRKWHPDAQPSEFKRIAPATRIYRSDHMLDPGAGLALHTVTVCELAGRDLGCEASALLAPSDRAFHVSDESAYVWIDSPGHDGQSGLFRLPLDGSAPSAVKVSGAPVDQLSFLGSGDGSLNVLLRTEGQGALMALLRAPLGAFSDGGASVLPQHYQALPKAGYDGVWRNIGLALREPGALESLGIQVEDACRASCADGLGIAGPLILGERVFAMMGDELVEGRVDGQRMREVGRIHLAPVAGCRPP